jgi:lysophospholipase L1-like esterase
MTTGFNTLGKTIVTGNATIIPYVGQYIVDVIGAAEAAYGLNHLREAYSGSGIKVRRSSDSTELDIGFNEDGSFDSSAFTTFIGGGSGFCTTMYDQSGGGRNLSQATTALQPEVVLLDGEYVLKCTGGDFLQNASFVGSLGGTFTAHILWKAPATTPSGFLSQVPGIDWAAGQNFLSPWWTTVQHGAFYSNNVATTSQAGWEDGKWRQFVMKYASSSVTLYEFGTQIQAAIARTEPAWSRLTIGKNDFGNGDFYFSEFILWDSSISQQTLFTQCKLRHANFLQTSSDNLYVNLGDSITTTLYSGLGKAWTKYAYDDAAISRWHTICQGGWRLQDLYDNRAIYNWYPANLEHNESILVVFAGTNDLATDGITGAQAFARLQTLVQNAKLNGFDKAVVVTPLPRFQTGTANNLSFEPRRQSLSALIVADTSGDFDAVVDVRTLAIGVDGEQDSLTYYVNDYIHLAAAGEEQLGLAVSTVLQAL